MATGVITQHKVYGKVRSTGPKRPMAGKDESSSSSNNSATANNDNGIEFLSGSGTSGSSGQGGDRLARRRVPYAECGGPVPIEGAMLVMPTTILSQTKYGSASSSSTNPVNEAIAPSNNFVVESSSSANIVNNNGESGDPSTTYVGTPELLEIHTSGKCSPCYYMSTRNACKKGAACPCCHYPHVADAVKPRPCRAQRMRFKRLVDEMGSNQNSQDFDKSALSFLKQGGYLRQVCIGKLQELGRDYLAGEEGVPAVNVNTGNMQVATGASASHIGEESAASGSGAGSASSRNTGRELFGARQREPSTRSAVKQAYKLAL